MKSIIDKVTVFLLCLLLYLPSNINDYIVVPVICAILVSALTTYLDLGLISLLAFLGICGLSSSFPSFLFFIPLLAYDLVCSRQQVWLCAALIPVLLHFPELPLFFWIALLLFIGLSALMKRRTIELETIRSNYIDLRDSSKELSMQLEKQNKELLQKQDDEINLATLNERNRIARDIHDSIGHTLSNSILQTGAMIATCRDETSKERLNTLKETLVSGMDSIRQSIHALYDDSVDLHAAAKALTDGFDFCELFFDYELESEPNVKIRFAFLYVIKECLSNIIKHSNATHVSVALREHPALYQLIIKDNGTKTSTDSSGIGLLNIEQRMKGLGGLINIDRSNGFTVFISVPKEAAE